MADRNENWQASIIEQFGEATCYVCGRTLRNPESRIKGIGPVCLAKTRAKLAKVRKGDTEQPIDPFDYATLDVTFRRKGTLGIVNVMQIHRHHSPTGMEWGFLGSGAADMALNILAKMIPARKGIAKSPKLWDGSKCSGWAWDLHQDFKQDFIAKIPYQGGKIPGDTIREWITSRGVPKEIIAGYEPA